MLFDRINGKLVHIPEDQEPAAKIGRRHHTVNMSVEILFTPEEEAARNSEEDSAMAVAAARAIEQPSNDERIADIERRLKAIEDTKEGLTK